MRGRTRSWLVVATVLLALSAFLMSVGAAPAPAKRREQEVVFPRWMRDDEWQRARARRTLPPVAVAAAQSADGTPAPPPPPRDPFLVALPRDATKPLVVLEANALRHSRIGELFIDCVVESSERDPFEEMRREAGIDPLKDIDRVAFTSEGFLVSGFFDRARFDRLEGAMPAARYGEQGRIYAQSADDVATSSSLGVWRDQLVAFGPRSFVQESIDRLEGRIPPSTAPIPEQLTYGEAYGVVPGAALESLFSGAHADLGHRLATVASRVELHADAMRDVALVANVTGPDAAQLDDLARSFGAALALGRLDARARGATELMDLLDHARVEHRSGGFAIEVALPVDLVERWFSRCGRRGANP